MTQQIELEISEKTAIHQRIKTLKDLSDKVLNQQLEEVSSKSKFQNTISLVVSVTRVFFRIGSMRLKNCVSVSKTYYEVLRKTNGILFFISSSVWFKDNIII